jgi:folate-binding protein YgfZ
MIVYNQKTMLTDAYKRDDVPLDDLFGVEYPVYFIHPVVEYDALVNAAGVIDLTHWRTFRFLGKDRVSFLNAMVTNDVVSLGENQGCHSLITTTKGKIIAELFLFVRKDDILAFVPQGNANEAYDVFQKHIIMEDVSLEDASSHCGVIALEGPKSEDILWRLFSTGPFPKELLHAAERTFKDAKVYLMKNSVTGEDGYHMMIPADQIERLRDYLVQAARGSDGLPIGGTAWNMRRIEKGLPWFDADVTEDNFPDEARLGSAISYTKGCFLGQETLARIHYRGHVNRVLVGLTVPDDEVPDSIGKLVAEFDGKVNNYDEKGWREKAAPVALALDLRTVFEPKTELFPIEGDRPSQKSGGWLTSVAFSPQSKKPLFLGYVRRDIAEQKQDVLVGDQRLTFVDLPVAGAQ